MILSADATPAAKQQSIEAGADEYLTKPVTAQSLLAAVERMTAGAAARVEPQTHRTSDDKTVLATPRSLVDADRVQALRRISRGDVKFLDSYVQAAFVDLERALSSLSVAAAQGDVRAARDALHIIEGTGASLGAVSLVENCKSMRQYMGAGQDPDRADALAELSTIYALTKSTLLAAVHETRGRARGPVR